MKVGGPGGQDERGFTVLELLIGLGVLAVAAWIAMPSLERSRSRLDLESGAQALAATLRGAQSAAVRRNAEVVVHIDPAARRYWADGQAGARILDGRTGVTVIAAEEVGTTGRIRFFPDGGAGGGRVVLEGGGRSIAVTVDWLTGHVRIERSR